jgi:Zn-dependent protease with chaperone function
VWEELGSVSRSTVATRLSQHHSPLPFVAFSLAGVGIIVTSIATCPNPLLCLRRMAAPDFWPQVLTWVVLPLVAALTLVWLARLAFVLARATHVVSRLPGADRPPTRLASALARTRVGRVRCVSARAPIAFCTGAVRPEIVVSDGLAERLDDDELDAVLLHEHQHLREREPVIRAAAEVAADVLFFLPIARWWAHRRTEDAELRADQAAVREVGPRPVAAALCMLDSALSPEAAFAGVAELRVAQLLGDPIPVRRPAAWLVAASLIGLPLTIATVGCVIQTIVRVGGF